MEYNEQQKQIKTYPDNLKFQNFPQAIDMNIILQEKNALWQEKEENINAILRKVYAQQYKKLPLKSRIPPQEIRITDPTLRRSVKLKQYLNNFELTQNQQIESYRQRLSKEKDELLNSKSYRKQRGSIMKNIRSKSQMIIKSEQNQIKQKPDVDSQYIQQLDYIKNKKKSLHDCSVRLAKLFREDPPNYTERATRQQSSLQTTCNQFNSQSGKGLKKSMNRKSVFLRQIV